MRKLYLRIYLAVLASLAAFALASGVLWRQFGSAGPAEHAFEMARDARPERAAAGVGAQAEQQAALAPARRQSRGRRRAVRAGSHARSPRSATPLAPPDPGRERGRLAAPLGGRPPGWAIRLPDGRWLVARVPA